MDSSFASDFGRDEGRSGLPTNFDSTYCYALGYAAGALLQSGKIGLISSVGNLAAPVSEWIVGGTALTSLMDVERRHGKYKPVIKKAMVELEGAPFKKFASLREEWAVKNCYISPGPIQFVGPASDAVNHTCFCWSLAPSCRPHPPADGTDTLGVALFHLILDGII